MGSPEESTNARTRRTRSKTGWSEDSEEETVQNELPRVHTGTGRHGGPVPSGPRVLAPPSQTPRLPNIRVYGRAPGVERHTHLRSFGPRPSDHSTLDKGDSNEDGRGPGGEGSPKGW